MAVEVAAGPVVPHRGAGISVSGGDLHVAQVGAGVEHGRDVGMAEHVRVRPGGLDAGSSGEVPQTPGGGMPVQPGAAGIQQDRPSGSEVYGTVDGPADGWRQRDQDDLGALAADTQGILRSAAI